MNFRKISGGKGGGAISDLKKIIAICFALEMAILVMNFWREKNFEKGGVISDLKIFIANLVLVQPVCGKNCNIFSGKGAGGGSKAV